MKKPVKSIQHKADKRAHIPSGEEAGYETGNPLVQKTPDPRTFSLTPIVHRGQDPELNWMDKYVPADLRVPVRSLYRHEHVAPESLISGLYRIVADKSAQGELFSTNELFGNALAHEELDKISDYYKHSDGWTNRLIQGDSLLCMTSLLEREGMAGRVQCIYIDPPYGIKYGSNWQIRLNSRTVTDGQDESLTGEPEQIKAFRDTYRLGVHSYLSYLRDRLIVASELLHDSGSCFVQISDENVHLVRCLMDEVFGSANFFAELLVKKKGSQKAEFIEAVNDMVLWYGKSAKTERRTKFRPLFEEVPLNSETLSEYKFVELDECAVFEAAKAKTPEGEDFDYRLSPKRLFRDYPKARLFRANPLTSGGDRKNQSLPFQFGGQTFHPGSGNCWKTTVRTDNGSKPGMAVLLEQKRLIAGDKQLRFKSYLDDFGYQRMSNWWDGLGGASSPVYVVQTNASVIQRCILMTTDPGDLVLDPTCGSGTTAYVAEQWGRRWITTDTSRIALNIAKTRLMTATFPFYTLYDTEEGVLAVADGKGKPGEHDSVKTRDPKTPLRGHNVRYGFVYKKVPHITLGSIANNEPAPEETLYDQPLEDKRRLRVAGPFTVETLQSYEPISPEELARQREDVGELAAFEDLIFEHLKSAGVKTGNKSEQAAFTRIDRLSSSELHAEGFYPAGGKEKKAYLHIGPKFGPVSKQAVNEAIKACRGRHDADWLLILGFAFESGLSEVTTANFGSFKVSIVRMHDDLLQEGLLKKDKKAASFVTIGEPDIRLHRKNGTATVEIAGLDIYDPIKDEVKGRDVHDIAYWMLDDEYDGSNFVVRQVFFCGGDKDEFEDWKKQLTTLAAAAVKKKVEQTLKIEIDDEAFAAAYGHVSRPFPMKAGQKVAVRVVSQFGEETTKVLGVKPT
jgi:adenine-specific DNA-methyltransferase